MQSGSIPQSKWEGEEEMKSIIERLKEMREAIHESIEFNHKEIARLTEVVNDRQAKVEELFKEAAEITKAIELLSEEE